MKKSTNRVQLLKAVSVSVNEFYFSPSKVRKGKARKAINELLEFVEAVELPTPKASKPKASPKAQPKGADEMMELFKQFLVSQGMTQEPPKVTKPKAKAKPKSRKTTTKKATPTQRVADRQEKAFHGRPDTPVTPSKAGKPKASVKEAQKAVAEVSKANGSTERITQRAKAQKEQVMKAFQAKLDLEFPLDGTANEVSFSDLSLRQLAELM
tara:strand:+ start:568 stop:1200 length:633 start_codon:yes stop_codon:yes gene_type:complete